MMISQKKNSNGDVVIGIVATASLALGVVITSWSGGFNVDVSNYMFGSILAINNQDVVLSAILGAIVITLFVIFYNRLFLITYDENYSRATGINVTFYQFLISFLTALTVVIGMRMMGSLLISSLIIFPATISMKISGTYKKVICISAVLSVLCFVIGMIVSFNADAPVGASIVVINIIVFIITSVVTAVTRRIR